MGVIKAKKFILWFIVLILIPGALFANQTIEELEKKLEKVSGEEKVDVLNRLAFHYQYKSVETALKYGEQALKLSRTIKDLKGEGVAFLHIGIGFAQSGDFDKALNNSQQALEIFERLDDERRIAATSKNIGNIYLFSGDYDNALEYFLKSLKMSQKLGDNIIIANSFGSIGSIYARLGNYDKALEYQIKALKIREIDGNKEGTAASFNSIGTIYARINNYDKALEYFLKSMEIKDEIGDNAGKANSLTNIGIIYTDLKDYEKALEYHLRALSINKEIGNKIQIPSILHSIGNIYLNLKNYGKALEYYLNVLEMGEKANSPEDICGSLVNIGYVYRLQHQYEKSLTYLQKGLKIAEEINAKESIKESYFGFSELYAAVGNYKKALEYFKLYTKIKDDIFNEKNSKQIAQMQTQYETLKKEKEIEDLKKNSRIQELLVNRQKVIRNASIVFALLVLIIAFQFFRRYRYLFTFWKKKNYIAHYKLVDKIGSGGMGDIYKAQDIQGKSRTPSCAIKVLKEEYYKDEKYKTRFKNEAAMIDQLNHPNIVKVMERGEFEGTLYIAMELLEGETLADLLEKEKQIDLKTALPMMVQMAGAIVEIHKRGIIHRDLKPENIMVTQAESHLPHVKILDFGLARTQRLTRLTKTGMIMGTIFYVSPEQLTRSRILPAGDIYSLGVIYYQVLTGEKPFSGDTAFDIARRILKKEPIKIETFQPDLPVDLSSLVKKMMAKDPEKRPSANEVLNQLKGIKISTGK